MNRALLRLTAYALVFLLSSFIVEAGKAANISILSETNSLDKRYGGNCVIARIRFEGDVSSGDEERLSSLLRDIDARSKLKKSDCGLNESGNRYLAVVEFNSDGGLYFEGLKIAYLLKKERVSSTVRNGDRCLSACAIAFLGGSVIGAEETTLISRAIQPRARLGFHAPFPVLPERSYSNADVTGFFLAAFTVINAFIKDSVLFGVPTHLVPNLFQPTPNDFFYVDQVHKALELNIAVQSSETFPFDKGRGSNERRNIQQLVNFCRNLSSIRNKERLSTSEYAELLRMVPTQFRSGASTISLGMQNNREWKLILVPTAHLAEGNVEYCAVLEISDAKTRSFNYDCLGLPASWDIFSEKTRSLKAPQDRVGYIRSVGGDCIELNALSSLDGDTKISNIQTVPGR